MKKILSLLIFIPFLLSAQIKVKDLPTTTGGSTADFLLKDDAAGIPGSTKKISVSNFNTTYSLTPTPALNFVAPLTKTTNTVTISQSTTSTNGYLSSTDWNTFNNKQSTISANTPLSISTNTLSISQSTTSTNGYLSSTDWNTFNNKFSLPALTSGSVLFSNGTTISQANSDFFWDNSTKFLGIGTATPSDKLHIYTSTADYRGITIQGDLPLIQLKNLANTVNHTIGRVFNGTLGFGVTGASGLDRWTYYSKSSNDEFFTIDAQSNRVDIISTEYATTGGQLKNSGALRFKSGYWNGSQNTYNTADEIKQVAVTTAPIRRLDFANGLFNIYDGTQITIGTITPLSNQWLINADNSTFDVTAGFRNTKASGNALTLTTNGATTRTLNVSTSGTGYCEGIYSDRSGSGTGIAVTGTGVNATGVYGFSTNQYGLYGDTRYGRALYLVQAENFTLAQSSAEPMAYIKRGNTGGTILGVYDYTGAVLKVEDQSGATGDLVTILKKGVTKLKIDSIGKLSIVAGQSSGATAKVGGSIFDHYADAGNTSTTETDLYSDNIPANTLYTNGDKITSEYNVNITTIVATTTQTIKIYFAGTSLIPFVVPNTTNTDNWTFSVTLIRVSSSVVRYKVYGVGLFVSSDVEVGELTGLTLSNSNILKITGQSTGVGAATNDIIASSGYVEWKPSAN